MRLLSGIIYWNRERKTETKEWRCNNCETNVCPTNPELKEPSLKSNLGNHIFT